MGTSNIETGTVFEKVNANRITAREAASGQPAVDSICTR